jgi:hypothetical protein
MFGLITTVGGRLGPFLGRQNPGFLAQLVARLRAAGATVGDKAGDVVKYFKSSPVAASLTLGSIAGLGFSMDELFNGVDMNDPDLRSFKDGLDKTTLEARKALGIKAHAMVMEAGAESESLDLQINEVERDLMIAREVLGWAKSFYGSANAAMRAHRLNQAFFEMPYDDVVSGYNNLRV